MKVPNKAKIASRFGAKICFRSDFLESKLEILSKNVFESKFVDFWRI